MAQEILTHVQEIQRINLTKHIEDNDDTITLYHGSSSKYLNEILHNGLQPRNMHGNRNFEDWENPSHGDLVYLSPYLQYWYAFIATGNNLADYEELHNVTLDYEDYYARTGDVPIIIEVSVPKSWLTFDEDIAYYRPFVEQYNENPSHAVKALDWQYSLRQHTCASLKVIPASCIKSIQGIAYQNLEITTKEQSDYGRMVFNWRFGADIPNEDFKAVCDHLVEHMHATHLEAFEEISHIEGATYHVSYRASALKFERVA